MISDDGQSRTCFFNEDVLQRICEFSAQPELLRDCSDDAVTHPLENLSRASKLFRSISLPFLFHKLAMRHDWEDTLARLSFIRAAPQNIQISIRELQFIPRYADIKSPPPKELCISLPAVLRSSPALRSLVIVIPTAHIEPFREAFLAADLFMPMITSLVVGPYCEFVVSSCPNVNRVSTNGPSWQCFIYDATRQQRSIRLIAACRAAQSLHSFHMHEWWDMKLLETLHEAIPALRDLAIVGMGDWDPPIEGMLSVIARFTRLEILALPDVAFLGVGFEPPECGNAYHGPAGEVLLQQVEREQQDAEQTVAEMVTSRLARLRTLWIGDYCRVERVKEDDVGFKDLTCIRDRRRDAQMEGFS